MQPTANTSSVAEEHARDVYGGLEKIKNSLCIFRCSKSQSQSQNLSVCTLAILVYSIAASCVAPVCRPAANCDACVVSFCRRCFHFPTLYYVLMSTRNITNICASFCFIVEEYVEWILPLLVVRTLFCILFFLNQLGRFSQTKHPIGYAKRADIAYSLLVK